MEGAVRVSVWCGETWPAARTSMRFKRSATAGLDIAYCMSGRTTKTATEASRSLLFLSISASPNFGAPAALPSAWAVTTVPAGMPRAIEAGPGGGSGGGAGADMFEVC